MELIEKIISDCLDNPSQISKYRNQQDDFFEKNYYDCDIQESILRRLIEKSIKEISYQELLSLILEVVSVKSITDNIFLDIINYPNNFRLTLLSIIGHKALKREQLESIYNISKYYETFVNLVIIYSKDNSITLNQFSKFLDDNIMFQKSFKYILDEIKLLENEVDVKKIEYLSSILEKK